MRWWAIAALVAVAGVAIVLIVQSGDDDSPSEGARRSARAAPFSVPCDTAVGSVAVPRPGSRRVLGAVVMPPRRVPGQPERLDGDLPYSAKWRILVRAGRDVGVSVPDDLRGRLAVAWGTTTQHADVRFARCPGRGWLAFDGGFRLAEPGCVALTVRSGGRSREVAFGVGRRC